eukprot:363933-Chlamydomonas_euryale.AAC.1
MHDPSERSVDLPMIHCLLLTRATLHTSTHPHVRAPWLLARTTPPHIPRIRTSTHLVQTLHKLLHAEFRGCFIPPLPPKSIIENSAEEFLRLRRADLQAYLRAIVGHPELVHSQALAVFLLQPGGLHRNPAWIGLVMPAGQHAARIGAHGGGALGEGGGWMRASERE